MRVLHLIDSLRVGGAQKLLLTYAYEARLQGKETNIASLRTDSEPAYMAEFDSLAANVYFFPGRALFDLGRIFRLVRFIRSNKFDVIHTHLTYANIIGLICGLFLRIPVVVSIHNIRSGRKILTRDRIEFWLLRHSAALIAVGENVASDYASDFPDKIFTVSNAVREPEMMPPQERASYRERLVGDVNAPLLIAIGRLSYQKGFADMVTAFQLIHQEYPKAHLIVAGQGKLRDELIEQTNQLGLQNNIHWLGVRDDVPALLAASDIYVSSSKWEGLSVAMLEAMSHGLALVVTNVGDAAKVISSGSGILVPAEEPAILAREVCELIRNSQKAEALGAAAKRRVRKLFDSSVWFGKLQEIYKQVSS